MNLKTKQAAALQAQAMNGMTACSGGAQSASSGAQSAQSAPAASSDAGETAAEEHTEEGSVVAASMNTVTILTADGRELNFPTVDATVEAADGLLEGDWVQG